MPEHVALEREPPVATVTIDRPERHNSLVPALLSQLRDALSTVEDDPDLRAVVLASSGSSFSTGGDVAAFHEHREAVADYAERVVGGLNDAILDMLGLSVPVVTAVDGRVNGGSIGFLLGSDAVYVTPEATITPYYGVVGFSPDGGWTALLPDVIGPGRTRSVLLANDTIEPEAAVEWGLADAVVELGDLEARARSRAADMAEMKAGSVARTRSLLAGDRDEIAERLERERRAFVAQIQTEEALEGMRAFLE